MAGITHEERWLALIMLLRSHGTLTAEELGKKLHVNARTVYRDIGTLSKRGVPIKSAPGQGGGYLLEERYPLDLVVYGRDEGVVELFLPEVSGLGVSTETMCEAYERLVSHVIRELSDEDRTAISIARKRIHFDTSKWFWKEAETESFSTVKQAVFSDTQLEILFYERDDPHLKKDVLDPYGLVWREGFWYVVGRSHAENIVCRHRISRLVGVTNSGTRFARPEWVNVRDHWRKIINGPGIGDIKVVLKLHETIVHEFESFRLLPGDRMVRRDNGAQVELYLDNYSWLIPLVLSYGARIEVIEPPRLRDQVTMALRDCLRKYEG